VISYVHRKREREREREREKGRSATPGCTKGQRTAAHDTKGFLSLVFSSRYLVILGPEVCGDRGVSEWSSIEIKDMNGVASGATAINGVWKSKSLNPLVASGNKYCVLSASGWLRDKVWYIGRVVDAWVRIGVAETWLSSMASVVRNVVKWWEIRIESPDMMPSYDFARRISSPSPWIAS
jgi:hypothetical protein